MWRTSPSRDSPDGGTIRSASCSPVRPAHLYSSVARCQSRNACSIGRSGPVSGPSGRSTSGAFHVTGLSCHGSEPSQPRRVGQHVDRDDLAVRDREPKHHPQPARIPVTPSTRPCPASRPESSLWIVTSRRRVVTIHDPARGTPLGQLRLLG